MADEMNKDVVGAKINLDTTKILPAFKVIDEGVRKNAESFKTLNAELSVTAKNYAEMAKAADKVALSSDERRKKIMDESNALVAQRTAQAELLQAKTKALDTTNQVIDAKLKAQQSIVKKREDAIEQQEKEHQQRMTTLQQKTAAASGQDNLVQAKIDRQFQLMKSGDAKLEMEAERHAARMTNLNRNVGIDNSPSSTLGGIGEKIQTAAMHAVVFHGVYSTINAVQHAVKEGLVDIEANMAGYIQTNEHYFVEFNKGTGEMVMNTQRLHEQTAQFIQTAHDLGANIMDVTESARLWGRMYKDVGVVQEMVRQSTKLSTVDLVGLQEATKMQESVLAQYGVQIKNVSEAQLQGNRVLDSWSSVAHNTMAPAKDLGDAFERTGKIASETGVSFDFMNGLMSSGIRNTALGGANLGNMWKTVLGTIRTDKAVTELESLGVATKKNVDGVEEWRKAEDILLDLSIAVIDKNYDLTQSYADISRGVFQFAKLAASMNVGDILLGQSASINSTGSTMEYLKVQMDTIQRKAAQTKASLLEIFNNAGDDGLRKSIKDVLDTIDQLLIGLTKVPKGVYEGTAALGALLLAYNLLKSPIMNLVTAVGVITAAKTAETAAIAVNTTAAEASAIATATTTVATESATLATVGMTTAQAAMAVTTAIATAGLSILAGIAMVWVYNSGKAEKAERDKAQAMKDTISAHEQMISQMQRQEEFVPKLVDAHNKLQAQYDKLSTAAATDTDASKKQIEIKGQLEKVSQALTATVKSEGLAQLQAAGFTAQAVQIQIDKIKAAREELRISNLQAAKAERDDIAKQMRERADQVNSDQQDLSNWVDGSKLNPFRSALIKKNINEVDQGVKEVTKLEQQLKEKNAAIAEMEGQPILDKLAGEEGKRQKETQDIEKSFQDDMSKVKHLINMKAAGYQTAAQQVEKLKQVRNNYKDKLSEEALYNLDEDIFRTGQGIGIKPEGFGGGGNAFSFPLNDIDNSTKQAKSLIESASSLIEFYNAKKAALSDSTNDAAYTIDLYTNRQNKLHESNLMMQDSLSILASKQNSLDQYYKSGTITLDEYNQQSESVTSRIVSLTKEIDANSVAWWNDAKAIKDAKDQQLNDTFDFSEKWIAHEKASREMNAKEEYEAWLRVQARYIQGSELRKRADEQVYAAKKALISEEEKNLDEIMSKGKTYLDKSKKAELDKIEADKKAYVDAQDEKIRAIDRLMQAEQNSYEDQDYSKKLKEKQDRLAVLQSAVGPDGIKEREDILKEIADMEQNHQRDLTKRGHEAEKQRLEDDKRIKEADFEKQKKDVETHYESLLTAFDSFKNDATGRAETLKQIQILKESEKNTEILKNLDTFISDYQTKMSSITNLTQSQEQIDLQRYNSNIDKWNSGDQTAKDSAHTENEAYRQKYNIPADSGKLQHFKDGGLVRGMKSQPVPVIAHAGEMFINERQQDNLFKLLNIAMPKISMPSLDFAGPKTVINQYYSFDNSINGGVAVNGTNGVAGLYDQRGGIIERQRSIGEKVR
jgi:hypothetical protein